MTAAPETWHREPHAAPAAPAPLFATLHPRNPLAGLQYRQTLILGLIPIGTGLLLGAALFPERPPMAMMASLSGGILLLALFAILWPLLLRFRAPLPGAGTLHFLVRCFLLILTPTLLWITFHRLLHETAGIWPFILLAVAVLLHPPGRICHEAALLDASPRWELARLFFIQTEILLGLFALLGFLSGAILEAHKDYPTDPTGLILTLWMLGLLLLLASMLGMAIQWARFRGPRPDSPPQPLDDPPSAASTPTATPTTPAIHYHSDEF